MHFTVEAHKIAERYLSPGAIAIDATAGNGFDTLFLAHAVGPSGKVFAFDVQRSALDVVEQKLVAENLQSQVVLIHRSHEFLQELIPVEFHGQVSVAMFNLGYLPFGDKSIVTRACSTLESLNQIVSFMRPGGLLSILAYRGHAGGAEEADAVHDWVTLSHELFEIMSVRDSNNSNSPELYSLVRKN